MRRTARGMGDGTMHYASADMHRPVFIACPPLLAGLVLGGLALAWPHEAPTQVRRCVGPSGGVVYTDRRCQEIGAVEQRPPAPAARQATRALQAATCARTVTELVYEVGHAFDAQDPNRLAALYHWPGTSSRAGYQVLARFELLMKRPLVDVAPVLNRVEPTGTFGTLEGPPPPRRFPVGVRIEQTLPNSITPVHTTFGLQQHLGCWWLRG